MSWFDTAGCGREAGAAGGRDARRHVVGVRGVRNISFRFFVGEQLMGGDCICMYVCAGDGRITLPCLIEVEVEEVGE